MILPITLQAQTSANAVLPLVHSKYLGRSQIFTSNCLYSSDGVFKFEMLQFESFIYTEQVSECVSSLELQSDVFRAHEKSRRKLISVIIDEIDIFLPSSVKI